MISTAFVLGAEEAPDVLSVAGDGIAPRNTWAIVSQETLEILSCGEVAATLMPRRTSAMEQARQEMARRFAAPDWNFAVGTPLTREERNARS